MESQKHNSDDQILIKMGDSPYYLVQPPLYDWDHPDTQAHIKQQSKWFLNDDVSDLPIEPKFLEPWKYRLASEYNRQYNKEHNIDPFAYLLDRDDRNYDSYSDDETDRTDQTDQTEQTDQIDQTDEIKN